MERSAWRNWKRRPPGDVQNELTTFWSGPSSGGVSTFSTDHLLGHGDAKTEEIRSRRGAQESGCGSGEEVEPTDADGRIKRQKKSRSCDYAGTTDEKKSDTSSSRKCGSGTPVWRARRTPGVSFLGSDRRQGNKAGAEKRIPRREQPQLARDSKSRVREQEQWRGDDGSGQSSCSTGIYYRRSRNRGRIRWNFPTIQSHYDTLTEIQTWRFRRRKLRNAGDHIVGHRTADGTAALDPSMLDKVLANPPGIRKMSDGLISCLEQAGGSSSSSWRRQKRGGSSGICFAEATGFDEKQEKRTLDINETAKHVSNVLRYRGMPLVCSDGRHFR
ncbi:unnamed protein product, partial [Amoebophrya sp. A25]|eukprot:GSA25T00013452001.1